jgi:hypothetical protein
MAGRGATTFQKRQKEQQRKEKRAEKLAKRLMKKNNPTPEGSPDDDIQPLSPDNDLDVAEQGVDQDPAHV